ncbi:hypothetical protein AB0E69_24375 [Kribbella sp. NPDC026611]|uniref:hypothetical protein n=1 Tax=Kribbella sp. NPDC026611 TaxID=3154911 RepID=UPI00340A1997
MSLLMTRMFLGVLLKPRPAGRERGDVPGWVLITVMTAGLVVAIWKLAGDQLADMLKTALSTVSNK